MRKKKIIRITVIIAIVLFVLYTVFIYFLVSACLVPSFMNKLDAFEDITVMSYSQQVQTADIGENRKAAIDDTKSWLAEARGQKLALESEDGYRLVAQEFYAKGDSHQWVLLLHGYTGWKEEMYPFAAWYFEQGFHVIVPDLRCQGESEGDFIGMGWTDHYDCNLWIQYILERDENAQVVLHGQSMGASTALIMAGDENLSDHVKAVVSDCAYTDAYSMFADKITSWFGLPAFPFVDSACLMLRLRGGYNLRNASAIRAVAQSDTPTLFIHGEEDALIPVEMAYELYEAAACEKELLIVEGAGHAQSQDKAPQDYYDTIRDFLETNGIYTDN